MQLAYSTRTVALRTFIVAVLSISLASPLDASGAASLEPSSLSSSLNISSLLMNNGSSLVQTNSTFYDVFPAAINANVQCDGARYGQQVDRVDCQDALQKTGTSFDYVPAAQRGLGRRPAIVLPQRYSSCKRMDQSGKTKRSWLPASFLILLLSYFIVQLC